MCNMSLSLLLDLFYFYMYFVFRYDEWIKADKIVRPANKNVPKIKHRKKIKVRFQSAAHYQRGLLAVVDVTR